ncbi:MAG: hypothetical protein AABZ39_17915 [Spirochaetota bacterium]
MRLRILTGVLIAFSLAAAPRSTMSGFHNYPNPFKASDTATTFKFSYSSPSLSKVIVTVFNPQGKQLYTDTIATNITASPFTFQWRGVDDKGAILAPGLYHAKLDIRTQDGDTLTAYTKVVVK